MKARVRWITTSLLVATLAGGCSNAKQGAVSGVGIGALSGLAIGSMTGSAGKGAAIGAVVGGVGGAVIGDRNRRSDQAAKAAAASQSEYQTGQVLNRLVGEWRISGNIDSGGGAMVPVNGTAKAVVDKNYFVRMDIRFTDPRTGQPVEGTSVISQRGGRALGMTNSFSTSPEVRSFQGEMDQTGTVFDFKQTEPKVTSRRIVIRMSNSPEWTADVWDGNRRVESYTFTSTAR